MKLLRQKIAMPHFKSLILTSLIALCLSACATKPKVEPAPIESLSCTELLAEIDRVETALNTAENSANSNHRGINGINTGVGVHGGSSSGIGVGVGISIGGLFNNNRNKQIRSDIEELRIELIALQKQALSKKC